jgi:hypothetical protein
MKGMLAVFVFIALTAFSWGVYGPVLHEGQQLMGQREGDKVVAPSRMRPFICVGLAYFGIAVVVPAVLLLTRGEKGSWSIKGIVWSLAAGAAGAVGALGIIMAFNFHGNPLYVMPLVFGCAPVINTFFTMITGKTYKETNPLFLAGLILVIAGAVTVLMFKPGGGHGGGHEALSAMDMALVAVSIAVTALSWGVYGPVLHWGQAAMGGSRMRPLMCVGLAYFVIAVLVPVVVLQAGEPGQWTTSGTLWSLAGGAAGAIGALGIILAFNYGGKPLYVMPLVFGGAPVVNTFTTMIAKPVSAPISPIFYAGLIIVAVGAVVVLVFAPKGGHKPAAGAGPKDKGKAKEAAGTAR